LSCLWDALSDERLGVYYIHAIKLPDTMLSRRKITGKHALKFAVDDAQSGITIQTEMIIFATNLSNKSSP
jgi:hypothetical protein